MNALLPKLFYTETQEFLAMLRRDKDVMPFARFVQPGRVALVAEGPLKGKLVSVVDVIDQTRALVDGPGSGVPRQQIRLNQLHLTKFRLKFPFTAPTRVVRKAWTDEKLNEKWAESQWAKKLENKEKRAQMTDYDRSQPKSNYEVDCQKMRISSGSDHWFLITDGLHLQYLMCNLQVRTFEVSRTKNKYTLQLFIIQNLVCGSCLKV
ncbi:unnamed protein product [Parnassius apollo]|uniref:(apollo) hypothetical protein n=1 Tax=Parnassius apollo TaxID=110799 RepID=A0A8S3XKH3_PARAO|nr:unnamed protein product [Parnassius apollo]